MDTKKNEATKIQGIAATLSMIFYGCMIPVVKSNMGAVWKLMCIAALGDAADKFRKAGDIASKEILERTESKES